MKAGRLLKSETSLQIQAREEVHNGLGDEVVVAEEDGDSKDVLLRLLLLEELPVEKG